MYAGCDFRSASQHDKTPLYTSEVGYFTNSCEEEKGIFSSSRLSKVILEQKHGHERKTLRFVFIELVIPKILNNMPVMNLPRIKRFQLIYSLFASIEKITTKKCYLLSWNLKLKRPSECICGHQRYCS